MRTIKMIIRFQTILLFFLSVWITPVFGEKPTLTIDHGGHMSLISEILFTNDGKYLVSASTDKDIRIWDIESGKTVRKIRGQTGKGTEGFIHDISLSPDNHLLAVGGWMGPDENPGKFDIGTIRLFDFENGEIVALLKGHTDVVNCLAFSPDGKYLISGSSDNTARIWNAHSGKIVHILKRHLDDINEVAFSPNNAYAITASSDQSLILWDVSTGKQIYQMRGHSEKVLSAAFTPDGKSILSGDEDGKVLLWEVKSGRLTKLFADMLRSIGRATKLIADRLRPVDNISISPDGTKVIIGNGFEFNNRISVLTFPEGELVTVFDLHKRALVTATDISPDGTMVATGGGRSKEIFVWDILTGRAIQQKMEGKGNTVWSVGFSNDGRSIAWGNTNIHYAPAIGSNKLEEHYAAQKRYINLHGSFQINHGPLQEKFQLFDENGLPALNSAGRLQNDSDYLRAVDSVGPIKVRSNLFQSYSELQILKNEQIIQKIERSTNDGLDHRSYALTRDGRTVISGGSHGVLVSYDTVTGKKIHDFVGHHAEVDAVAISPDERLLISGSRDQTVKLWNLKTGELLVTVFFGLDKEWVAWTPEGYFTASPRGDQYIGWIVNKGENKNSDFYSAHQFRRYLYRPDIVNDTLATGSSKLAISKAGMEKISVNDLVLRAPVGVKIDGVKPLNNGLVTITIRLLKNTTTVPERITIYINGAQVLKEEQRLLKNVHPGDTLNYTVDLPFNESDQNHVKVLVENEWAETGYEMNFEHYQWENENRFHGILYVTAIGINDYPNLPPDLQLKSPGIDANSIVNRLKQLEGILYDKVIIKLITNQNTLTPITADIVEEALKQQGRQAGPHDTSIMFLAGHGVTDSNGNYHFMTADTLVNSIQGAKIGLKAGTSFNWNHLHKILSNTMGKRVVIVDTCQAGKVLSRTTPDIKKLVKDIHDVNAIIYSGTSRQQFGRETEKGGVFTQAIISGLDGEAQYEGYNLPFNALKAYVDFETPQLNLAILKAAQRSVFVSQSNAVTSNQPEIDYRNTQQPVAVVPPGMKDFVIYRQVAASLKQNETIPVSNEEMRLWKQIYNSEYYKDFENFIKRFPQSRFRLEATNRLQKLKNWMESKFIFNFRTKLLWQKEIPKELNWYMANKYCLELSLAGYNDWLLPTKDELLAAHQIASKFQKENNYYWSATPHLEFYTSAWLVGTDNRWLDFSKKNEARLYVRCVRKVRSMNFNTLSSQKKFSEEKRHEMVVIPAGEFPMGSGEESNEKPLHIVYLDEFQIDKREVTVEQYKKCYDMGICYEPKTGKYHNWSNVYFTRNQNNHPINGVDWEDAKIYCQYVNKRLPTEAEWEKAAIWKKGYKYKYPSGKDSISCKDAVLVNSNTWKDWKTKGGCDEKSTWPAGSKPEEINGTYDMAGNVWEWVADLYDQYDEKKQKNPTGPKSGSKHVIRGGGWKDDASVLRGTYRLSSDSTARSSEIGFRCALSTK